MEVRLLHSAWLIRLLDFPAALRVIRKALFAYADRRGRHCDRALGSWPLRTSPSTNWPAFSFHPSAFGGHRRMPGPSSAVPTNSTPAASKACCSAITTTRLQPPVGHSQVQ